MDSVASEPLPAQSAPALDAAAADTAAESAAASDAVANPASAKEDPDTGFLKSLAGTVLSSIPVLSAILFVAAAIKVFRASNMETTTTVAVINSADVVTLLQGVILTLLPGFLAGVVAAAIWLWSRDTVLSSSPETARSDAQQALRDPRIVLVWVLLVIAFYTITWPLFLIFLVPVAAATTLLIGQSRGRWLEVRWPKKFLNVLRRLSALVAILSILLLALSSTVWLPLRAMQLKPGATVRFDGKDLPPRFGAFILSSTSSTTSLLLNSPRGVLQISTSEIEPNPPLCIPPISRIRWVNLRASQIVHADKDYGSPYQVCPGQR